MARLAALDLLDAGAALGVVLEWRTAYRLLVDAAALHQNLIASANRRLVNAAALQEHLIAAADGVRLKAGIALGIVVEAPFAYRLAALPLRLIPLSILADRFRPESALARRELEPLGAGAGRGR